MFDLVVDDDRWSAIGDLTALAGRCADASANRVAPLQAGTASLLLTDDAALRDLNHRFRGKDMPTNVLSFPAAPPFRPFLGDIAIAYGVTAREAADRKIAIGDHLAHLIVHGLLHLIGYDHETAHDAEIMEDLETRILAQIGVNNPYLPDMPDLTAEDGILSSRDSSLIGDGQSGSDGPGAKQ